MVPTGSVVILNARVFMFWGMTMPASSFLQHFSEAGVYSERSFPGFSTDSAALSKRSYAI